ILQRWTQAAQEPIGTLSAEGAAATGPSPVDESVLESFRQLQEPGAPDIVAELVELFLTDLPGRVQAVGAAAARNDCEGARATAHALKSSAAYIGAKELARHCAEMEGTAREKNAEGVRSLAVTIEREAATVRDYFTLRPAEGPKA